MVMMITEAFELSTSLGQSFLFLVKPAAVVTFPWDAFTTIELQDSTKDAATTGESESTEQGDNEIAMSLRGGCIDLSSCAQFHLPLGAKDAELTMSRQRWDPV
jgi:hypothetical protein